MTSSQPPSERPAGVRLAIMLILFTLMLGVGRSFMEWSQVRAQIASTPHVSTQMMETVMLIVLVVVLGLMLWLTYMIARGRNWARITFLVLFLVGLPWSVPALLRSFSAYPFSATLGLAQILLQAVALILLFGADARRWFAAPAAPPPIPG